MGSSFALETADDCDPFTLRSFVITEWLVSHEREP